MTPSDRTRLATVGNEVEIVAEIVAEIVVEIVAEIVAGIVEIVIEIVVGIGESPCRIEGCDSCDVGSRRHLA